MYVQTEQNVASHGPSAMRRSLLELTAFTAGAYDDSRIAWSLLKTPLVTICRVEEGYMPNLVHIHYCPKTRSLHNKNNISFM